MKLKISHFPGYKTLWLLSLGALVFYASSCDPDDDDVDDNPQTDSFDVTQLLAAYESTIIQPNIDALVAAAEELDNSVSLLQSNPSENALADAQSNWRALALAYSGCQSFNFGPGESTFGSFAENIATFPVSVEKITGYIDAEDFTLNNFDRDTRGVYGLDYLLFQQNALSDLSNANYAAYTSTVASDVLEQAQELEEGWSSYGQEFATDAGTEVSSGITELYNAWIKGFEVVKNFKVGIPAGLRVGQTEPDPTQVAGLYSGTSRELVRNHLEHIEVMYFGDLLDADANAIGFDDYLLTTVGGAEVLDQTKEQWQVIWSAYNDLPNQPLDDLVVNETDKVETLYTALSQHTRFFKSELSSRLGLTITFDSGDGD